MAEARVLLKDDGGVTVATVEIAEMDPAIIDTLIAHVQRLASADKRSLLLIDVGKVRFFDSIALGSLVVLLRQVKETGGRLGITGLSGHSHKVLQVTGLDKVFELFDDRAAALEELQRSA